MTQSQSNWLTMFCSVHSYCQLQKKIAEKNPAFATGINSLGQLIASIKCINTLLPGPGETNVNPGSLREAVFNLSRTQTALATAYAKDTTNPELEQQLEFSKEDAQLLSDTELKLKLQFLFELVQLLSPHLAVYGNNTTALHAWELALNNYMPVLDSPRSAMMRRKQLMVCFNRLFKDALALCSDYLDPLAEPLKKKHPSFHLEYLTKRKTDDPGANGVRIRGIVRTRESGSARKSSSPLAEASITLVETGAVIQSDVEGVFSFRAVKKGTYTLRAEKQGYYTKTSEPMQLKEGETAHLEFELTYAELLQD